MTEIKSVSDLERVFASALNKPVAEVSGLFDFMEEEGFIVAVQPRKTYLNNVEWTAVYRLTRDLGGKAEKNEGTGEWTFRVPKASGGSDVPAEVIPRGKEESRGESRAEEVSSRGRVGLQHNGSAKRNIEVDKATNLRVGSPNRESVQTPQTWQPEYPPKDAPITPGYYPEFPVDRILSPHFNFRADVTESAAALMSEIHAAGMIIEPLVCRPASKPGYVERGPGERRLYAAKQLGMKTVPLIVEDMTDAEFDRIRLLENLARKDLTDMELARVLKYLMDKYTGEYLTQEALAQAFGKTQVWVSQHLAMLQLEADQSITAVIKPEKLSERQARDILAAPPEKRQEVAKQIAETGLVPSIQEEREIRKIIKPETRAKCARCGNITLNPKEVDGQQYCWTCSSIVESEKGAPKKRPPLAGFEPGEEEPGEGEEGELRPLTKSVVLEALERDLYALYPEGVPYEEIEQALAEFDTTNLAVTLTELEDEGKIRQETGGWMPIEKPSKPQQKGDEPAESEKCFIFDCPDCNGQTFMVVHVGPGRHIVKPVTVVEDNPNA